MAVREFYIEKNMKELRKTDLIKIENAIDSLWCLWDDGFEIIGCQVIIEQ